MSLEVASIGVAAAALAGVAVVQCTASPNGDWTLASTDQEEEGLFTQPAELVLVDPDGGERRRLGGKGGLFGTGPNTTGGTWSPDGEWIAFSCSSTGLCVTRSDWKHDWLGIAAMQLGEPPLSDG